MDSWQPLLVHMLRVTGSSAWHQQCMAYIHSTKYSEARFQPGRHDTGLVYQRMHLSCGYPLLECEDTREI